MAILFFSLRGVPVDEAEDVRSLLIDNSIEFYETPGGNWGVSMPAIWLYHQEDLETIQPVFDAYQHQRTIQQRNLYHQLKQSQQQRSFIKIIQIITYSSIMILTLYVSFKWLFELGL
ncbi:DUF6164 family protein [Methylomonas sp. AM2-LC]|uniref:DUF6164 family protein n=1 Tax=Methylomonas sp. AM2-LC TaxID=3153301 RepID=UPI003267D460